MFWRVVAGALLNEDIEFKLVPELIGATLGPHLFALYGVDLIGTVSRAVTFFATVVEEQKSVMAERSRSPAHSTQQQTTEPTERQTRSRMSYVEPPGKGGRGLSIIAVVVVGGVAASVGTQTDHVVVR
jgi:hypothetical protein